VDITTRVTICELVGRYALEPPHGQSEARASAIANALGLSAESHVYFSDPLDRPSFTGMHCMAELGSGEVVDLAARSLDEDADYPTIYDSLESAARTWRTVRRGSGSTAVDRSDLPNDTPQRPAR
jgi:hypothetical protein